MTEGAEEGIGCWSAEARLAGAGVPSGHVDTVRVGAASVQPRGAFVHVQLARRTGEPQPAPALARRQAKPAILAGRLAHRC